jgi:hypothetical protein
LWEGSASLHFGQHRPERSNFRSHAIEAAKLKQDDFCITKAILFWFAIKR